jgi:hypothetical protein
MRFSGYTIAAATECRSAGHYQYQKLRCLQASAEQQTRTPTRKGGTKQLPAAQQLVRVLAAKGANAFLDPPGGADAFVRIRARGVLGWRSVTAILHVVGR